MKREAPTSTKMRRFCKRLDLRLYMGVGILESLWHLTAREAPAGDIGKLDDEDIASYLDYEGDPGDLIAALVHARWLDVSEQHRLVIHDWHVHSDDATDNRLARAISLYANGDRPRMNRLSVSERASLCARYAKKYALAAHGKPLPDPVPDPVPDPDPDELSDAKASSPRPTSGKVPPVEAIYGEYPRKVGKQAAVKAIEGALKRIAERHATPRAAQEWLFRRVQAYARAPAGKRGELTPHPSTWFNQGRYDDDPKEWDHDGKDQASGGSSTRGAAVGRVDRSKHAFRQAAIASVEASGGDAARPNGRSLPGAGAAPGHGDDVPARSGNAGRGIRDADGARGAAAVLDSPEVLPPSERGPRGAGGYGDKGS